MHAYCVGDAMTPTGKILSDSTSLQVSTRDIEFLLPDTNVIHAIYSTIIAILACIVMGIILFLIKKRCSQGDLNLQSTEKRTLQMISTFSCDEPQCEEPQYDEVRSYKGRNKDTSFKLKENEAYIQV